MTTSLSPNPNMLRGSWRRTFVSRTKFFFKPERLRGWAAAGLAARASVAGRDPERPPRISPRGAAGRAERGRRDGPVPPAPLRVVKAAVRALHERRLRVPVLREGRDPERDRHPERPLLR